MEEGRQAAGQEEVPQDTAGEANNVVGLYEFLEDDGRHLHYVDYMLEAAEAAATEPKTAHGNGYWVKISPEQVTIECQHTDAWGPVSVSRELFLSTLRAWKAAGCCRTPNSS
jgi:hypothetical protein